MLPKIIYGVGTREVYEAITEMSKAYLCNTPAILISTLKQELNISSVVLRRILQRLADEGYVRFYKCTCNAVKLNNSSS